VVELQPELADGIARLIDERSTSYRRLTASDVIREAVAAFILPDDETLRFQSATDSSESSTEKGKSTNA
jgi:hypothetical protein